MASTAGILSQPEEKARTPSIASRYRTRQLMRANWFCMASHTTCWRNSGRSLEYLRRNTRIR